MRSLLTGFEPPHDQFYNRYMGQPDHAYHNGYWGRCALGGVVPGGRVGNPCREVLEDHRDRVEFNRRVHHIQQLLEEARGETARNEEEYQQPEGTTNMTNTIQLRNGYRIQLSPLRVQTATGKSYRFSSRTGQSLLSRILQGGEVRAVKHHTRGGQGTNTFAVTAQGVVAANLNTGTVSLLTPSARTEYLQDLVFRKPTHLLVGDESVEVPQ